MTELLKLKARVEELEGALKPFVNLKIPVCGKEGMELVCAIWIGENNLHREDIENARAVLNRKGSDV